MVREPQDPLQALLERESKIRQAVLDPEVTEIDTLGFSMQQLGLEYALVSKDGRIWGHTDKVSGKLQMVFDPKAGK